MNLMGTSMWGVGYNLVLARKRRLLRRYAVTPMRRGHFLLSYFFSRILFLGARARRAGRVRRARVRYGGARQLRWPSASSRFSGAAAFAAMSLVIGARVENTEVANGWMNFVQLPMWVLSGAFFSYERFPEWLHAPIRLLPLTALVDALRAVSNAGASLVDCGAEIAVMSAWCALGFVVALRTFRWQ